ncbi:MAG TPA: hypothetical protein VNN19_05670 [bacterium]|nr:hypothetical protein [bacterium]
MGRTTQTMTQLVAQEEACWAPFRRALRREDQRVFDRLFAAARHHTAPAHYASHATPFDAILLAMVLETMKAVEALARRLDALAASRETADSSRSEWLPHASP